MKKITFLFLILCFNFIQISAQTVTNYSFSQTTEIYTSLVGTNSSANGDDGNQNAIPIGFTFNFSNVNYSSFSISTNGFIRLGNGIAANNWENLLANNAAQTPLIAPFWDDHNRSTGNIQYQLSGVAPNRILQVGWDNISISNNGQASATIFGSFKIRLFETSNQIDFVYSSNIASAGAISASIGLNDLTSFLSVSPSNVGANTSSITANNAINSSVNITGKKYTFIPQPQCSGLPTPGNTISSSNSVCSGSDFILSLQNPTTAYGVSYQWQISTDNITFNNIVGATDQTYIASQTTVNYYKCLVTCSTIVGQSNSVLVSLNQPAICFCDPTYTYGKTVGDLISNVILGNTTLSNNTGTAPQNPSYTYFTGQPNYTATLNAGFVYNLTIFNGTYGEQNQAVWIDYNDDTIFTPEERIGYSLESINANSSGSFLITLDCNAPAGIHRMRIRDVWNVTGDTIDPCQNYGYGETEDYDITIITVSSCQQPYGLGVTAIAPTSATLNWNTGCNQISWDVHVTTLGSGIPTGAPSNPNVSNPFTVIGLTPNTNYEFYVMAICDNTGNSIWAGPYTFTTAPLAVANDDCTAAILLTVGSNFNEFSVVGTNVGASKSLGSANPTCAAFGFGGDVWYKAVVPSNGAINFETQFNVGSNLIDTGINLFSGSCNNLLTLACSDDEGVDAFSLITYTGLIPGETVYVRVWEYANDTFGTFKVSAWNPTLASNSFVEIDFKAYPNPVKDIMNFSYSNNISNIVIINLLGQKVLEKEINASQFQVNLSELSIGTYIVKLKSGDETKSIKIIKE